jgi:hypothetical protein
MPGTQRTRRTRTRVKRTRTTSPAHGSQTPADNRAAVLETIRNRRYIAFVRAIVGATRLRNSSR